MADSPNFTKSLQYKLEYFFVLVLAGILRPLPFKVSSYLISKLALASFYLLKKRRTSTLENLRFVFSKSKSEQEIKAIAKKVFQNTAITFLEFALAEKVFKNISKYIQGEMEYFHSQTSKDKGVILACSHLGAFEYLEFFTYQCGRPGSVIVKTQKNPYINELINNVRKRLIKSVEKTEAIRPVLRALKQNELVAILIDQWDGPNGIWVEFFGKKTSTTNLPARLAKKSGADIIPGFCIRKSPGNYYYYFGEVIKYEDREDWDEYVTIKLNQVLENEIRKYPEQWIWGHRRWKEKPE